MQGTFAARKKCGRHNLICTQLQIRGELMNKDQVKGAVNDAAGRAKRQVGEWTGDTSTQVEGAAQQVKGKAQKAWGDVKDAAHNASENVHRDSQTGVERERELEREREAGREEERQHAHSGSKH
jgi:uncharacterized protein YjbJ (UPF0337 family)